VAKKIKAFAFMYVFVSKRIIHIKGLRKELNMEFTNFGPDDKAGIDNRSNQMNDNHELTNN